MRSLMLVPFVLCLALLSAHAAPPEEKQGSEREALRKAHARLEDLQERAAAAATRDGGAEEAAKLSAKAAALREEIGAMTLRLAEREARERAAGEERDGERKAGERHKGAEQAEQKERQEILQGLEEGIRALRRMGRNKEAELLLNLAREIAAPREGEGWKERQGADAERAAARKQLEILRMAMKGCIDAKRPKEADLLEHAIHVQEMNLEGRRDEEANEIRRKGPDRETRQELLAFASRCLRELGRVDQAELVAKAAGITMRREGARSDRSDRSDRPDRPDRPDRAEGPDRQALLERLERLEVMVRELQHALEGMQRESTAQR